MIVTGARLQNGRNCVGSGVKTLLVDSLLHESSTIFVSL